MAIPGMVPENYDDIAGCRFADRCPYRREACDNPQELYCFGEGHAARCIVAFEEERGERSLRRIQVTAGQWDSAGG